MKSAWYIWMWIAVYLLSKYKSAQRFTHKGGVISWLLFQNGEYKFKFNNKVLKSWAFQQLNRTVKLINRTKRDFSCYFILLENHGNKKWTLQLRTHRNQRNILVQVDFWKKNSCIPQKELVNSSSTCKRKKRRSLSKRTWVWWDFRKWRSFYGSNGVDTRMPGRQRQQDVRNRQSPGICLNLKRKPSSTITDSRTLKNGKEEDSPLGHIGGALMVDLESHEVSQRRLQRQQSWVPCINKAECVSSSQSWLACFSYLNCYERQWQGAFGQWRPILQKYKKKWRRKSISNFWRVKSNTNP